MQDEALYECYFLLFEDPALEAEPRHEVAVRVGQHKPQANDTVGPSARSGGVHRFEDPVGTTALIPNCGGNLLEGTLCIVCRFVLFYATPLQWGIVTCCCCCSISHVAHVHGIGHRKREQYGLLAEGDFQISPVMGVQYVVVGLVPAL